MNYEIIEMEERTVIGIATVTNNASPDMGSKIGQLWQKLYSGTVEKMTGRVNGKCIGLYCDYQQNGDYTVLAGCEIEKSAAEKNKDAETTVKIIPKGKYAKFVVKGDVQKAVAESWGAIWNTPLERTFTGDFEEYQEDCDGKNGTIFIYIAIK